MKKILLLIIIFFTNILHSQSFTDIHFTGGGSTISNSLFTMFTRIGEEFVGTARNDEYILYIGSIYNFESELVTEIVEEGPALPVEVKLFQNYPNPFNPTTTVKYQIPSSGYVIIKVFDLLGKEIISLVDEEKLPGNYSVTFDGRNLSSGIYFYQIRFGNFIETKKLLLIK